MAAARCSHGAKSSWSRQRGRRFPCATCHVQGQSSAPLHVAVNGQDAIDYLMGNGPYVDRAAYPLPHCIFLDLKLPFIDGFEILEWRGLGHQPTLAHISVFILSSSPEHRDRRAALPARRQNLPCQAADPTMLIEALQGIPECVPACVPVAEVVA